MKHKFTIILWLFCLSFSVKAQQRYLLDVKKSKIFWKIETVGKHNGFILFNSGYLNYSASGRATNASFIIDMQNIRSTDRPTAEGRSKVDNEMKTAGFFDVANYKTAKMAVKNILPTPSPTIFRVTGDLTIKNITNAIVFDAKILKKGDAVYVKSEFKIARNKWKIDFHEKKKDWDFLAAVKDQMIDDDIQINLDLTFHK